jgi:hypothetical protein
MLRVSLVAVPFGAVAVMYSRSVWCPGWRFEPVELAALWREFVRTPGSLVYVLVVVSPFVIAPIAGAAPLGLVSCPGLFLCALLTLMIPIQPIEHTVAMKVVIAKVTVFLAAALRAGSLKNDWYVRGLAFLFACAALGVRMWALKNVDEEPLPPGLNAPPMPSFAI